MSRQDRVLDQAVGRPPSRLMRRCASLKGVVVRWLLLSGLLVLALMAATVGAALSQTQWPEVQGKGICLTQLGWCPLADPARTPVGVKCYCVMPGNSYIYGVTTEQRYYGRVNPYFNPHPPPVPGTIK